MQKRVMGEGTEELGSVVSSQLRVIIAGGGTGGHLFPAVAIANEIIKRYGSADIRFVIGRRKMESEILTRLGFHQQSIRVEGIKGRGWKKGMMVLIKLPYGFFQSVSILRRFSPHLVLGVGGYSSGPVCIAARLMGIPTAIHEQNSFPGLTNRLLCRFVDKVFVSFEESRQHFPGGNLYLTGNPVREELLTAEKDPRKRDERFTILVVGGSLGALALNRAFVAALQILRKEGKDPSVIHQSGETDYARVVEAYERRGLEGKILPFIEDMASAYRQADVVVSRAGATTVSELAALGKPSILVPYPFATNRHQETNALMLARVGGAEMILERDLSGESLAELLVKYMDKRSVLVEMGKRAAKAGRHDAAKVIVDHLETMRR
jgi:UDP-N-acetylglucosamine--N-acetylmuramyl-(pentapeptide) pyrophosphoryl-undecaprenol N-acetylglucosamine transferase